MIPYEYAEKFEQDSIHKDLLITYDGGSITNSELDGENFELDESICSQNELKFGCCESSYVQFSIGYGSQQLEGKELTITTTPAGATTPLSLGHYKVFSDIPTADRKWRDILAYDKMYEILNTDLADWYNTLFYDSSVIVSVYQFRNSLFNYLGVTQESASLVNDGLMLEKTIEPKVLTGKDVLIPLCELNGCFGRMSRQGTFEYVYLKPPAQGLFPDLVLYPATDLYPTPNGNAQEVGKNGNYISAKYEDYVTDFISGIQIREKENDVGVTVGEDDNLYIIENNFLVYGQDTATLTLVANNILNKVKWLYYTPAQIETPGNPCLQAGDGVKLVTAYAIVETFILKRTLKGVQALKDTLSADGSKEQNTQKNGLQKELIQLKGKSNELEISIEETKSTITDVEAGLQSQITQNAGSITAEVTRATGAESAITTNLNAEINRATTKEGQLNTAIANEVTRAQTQEGTLSSSIQALPGTIMAQVQASYATKGSVTTAKQEAITAANGYTNTQLLSYDSSVDVDNKILVSEQGIMQSVSTEYYNQTEVDGLIDGLQAQIDNRTTLWTVDAVPTLNNYPANQWTTDADKDQHLNDIALVSTADPSHAGENYRFEKHNNIYGWTLIQDTVATQALQKANEALQGVSDINTDLVTNYETKVNLESIMDQKDQGVKTYVGQRYETILRVQEKVEDAIDTADSHTATTLLDYWTSEYTSSQIQTSAAGILQEVERTYETHENADATYSSLRSSIEQNADAIELKVDADGIISSINQSSEQVSINANKINLNGAVTANNNFKINIDGTVEAVNAVFSGSVMQSQNTAGTNRIILENGQLKTYNNQGKIGTSIDSQQILFRSYDLDDNPTMAGISLYSNWLTISAVQEMIVYLVNSRWLDVKYGHQIGDQDGFETLMYSDRLRITSPILDKTIMSLDGTLGGYHRIYAYSNTGDKRAEFSVNGSSGGSSSNLIESKLYDVTGGTLGGCRIRYSPSSAYGDNLYFSFGEFSSDSGGFGKSAGDMGLAMSSYGVGTSSPASYTAHKYIDMGVLANSSGSLDTGLHITYYPNGEYTSSATLYGRWYINGSAVTSDERLKKDIKPIDDKVVEALGKVELKQFIFNNPDETYTGDIVMGAIAQDVIRELENAGLNWKEYNILDVRHNERDGKDYYGLSYNDLLIARNAYLEKRVDELEARIEKLEKMMEGKQDE